MRITPDLFGAYLKCPTKCFLRAHGEAPSGNAYAEWVRNQNETYRGVGVSRLKERVRQEHFPHVFAANAESPVGRINVNVKVKKRHFQNALSAE